jgi:tRNA threonylcarbamoyladenosine biosynthesis protein TsaE
MKQEIVTQSVEETKKVARDFSKKLKPGSIVCLRGDLGSGKTAFAQGVLSFFDAKPPYTSPTFLIIKEYKLENTPKKPSVLYHIDAYRISSKDLLEQGWRDIVQNKNAITLIEWPERVLEIVPTHAIVIDFSWESERERLITIPDKFPTNTVSTKPSSGESPFL